MTGPSQGIEPMTAAGWDNIRRVGAMTINPGWAKQVAAALEEREANLAHARLGSLVAAIREHKMFDCIAVFPRDKRDPLYGFPDANGLTNALAHLDSLLPMVGASGQKYRHSANSGLQELRADGLWWWVSSIPVEDAPIVAALLAGGGK